MGAGTAQYPRGRNPVRTVGMAGPGGPMGSRDVDGDTLWGNSGCPRFKVQTRSCATFVITGTTKDYTTLASIPGCTIEVFRTSDDVNVAATTSDGSGNFSVTVASNADTYFLVAFNAANTAAGVTLEGIIATPVGT